MGTRKRPLSKTRKRTKRARTMRKIRSKDKTEGCESATVDNDESQDSIEEILQESAKVNRAVPSPAPTGTRIEDEMSSDSYKNLEKEITIKVENELLETSEDWLLEIKKERPEMLGPKCEVLENAEDFNLIASSGTEKHQSQSYQDFLMESTAKNWEVSPYIKDVGYNGKTLEEVFIKQESMDDLSEVLIDVQNWHKDRKDAQDPLA